MFLLLLRSNLISKSSHIDAFSIPFDDISEVAYFLLGHPAYWLTDFFGYRLATMWTRTRISTAPTERERCSSKTALATGESCMPNGLVSERVFLENPVRIGYTCIFHCMCIDSLCADDTHIKDYLLSFLLTYCQWRLIVLNGQPPTGSFEFKFN